MKEQERLIDKNGNTFNSIQGVGDNYGKQMEKQR